MILKNITINSKFHHRLKIKLYKKTGRQQLLLELLKEFEPIVLNMIKKYKRRNYYIDLYNSGIVGIMNGIKHWNTETNSTAYKYIKLYILGEIMDEIKNNYEMTRDEMEKLANEITTEKFKYDDMLESVMMLDDENKQIMTMYAYGYSFGEIAVEMNSKEHTIRRQYNKLIKTMRL